MSAASIPQTGRAIYKAQAAKMSTSVWPRTAQRRRSGFLSRRDFITSTDQATCMSIAERRSTPPARIIPGSAIGAINSAAAEFIPTSNTASIPPWPRPKPMPAAALRRFFINRAMTMYRPSSSKSPAVTPRKLQ